MRFYPFLIGASISAIVSAQEARADDYDTNASGCVINDTSLVKLAHNGTTITYRPGQTGVAYVTCAITHASFMTAPSNLLLSYVDNSTVANNYLYLSYARMDKATGAVSTVAVVDSACNDGTNSPTFCTAGFTDSFDPSTYYYYVTIEFNRTSSQNMTLYGISIY